MMHCAVQRRQVEGKPTVMSEHWPKYGAATMLACATAGMLCAPPAQAEDGIDATALRQFGGRYAIDCTDPAGTQLRVAADALIVEQAGQRMTGRNPVSAYGHFGASAPPKNFQIALSGEVRSAARSEARGGPRLIFLVYADEAGPYIVIDGDARVSAALTQALTTPRCRRCGPRGAPLPSAIPAMSVLIADPAFKLAYLRAIGAKASARWLARLDGPAPPTRAQRLDGTPYVVVAICKAHDCYDHSAVFLYSAARQRVVGLIQQRGMKTLARAPGPMLASQLDWLWCKEWRQQ